MNPEFRPNGDVQGSCPTSGAISCSLVATLSLLLFLLFGFGAVSVWSGTEEQGSCFDFSGYYKNLPACWDFPFAGQYFDDLQRLRLHFDVNLTEFFGASLDYDLEMHSGDFTRSFPFLVMKYLEPKQYFGLDGVLLEDNNPLLTHSLYRAFFRLSLARADMKVGRQTMAWGPGRCWNPTDPFYPVNPLVLEKEEKINADALNLEIPVGALSSLNLVAAGRGKAGKSFGACRYRGNTWGTDWAFTFTRDNSDSSFGLDFSRTVLKSEVHGACFYPETNGLWEWILGADYTFPNTLKLSLEYYCNGPGNKDKQAYAWWNLIEGKQQFLGRDYLFFGSDYELTPLLRFQTCVIGNLNDGGVYFNPVLKYSTSANTEISLGWIGFESDSGDEFSLYPEILYLQFQAFF